MPRHASRNVPRLLALVLALVITLGTTAASLAAQDDSPQGRRRGGGQRQASAERQDQRQEQEKKDEGLTLEKAFPERSPFGPTASSAAFSRDGRFAAFLYRPYAERRHGPDLYVYDTTTGQSRRVTSASRMAEYQADARTVVEDRTKKARDAKHPKVAEIEARGRRPGEKQEAKEEAKAEAPPTTRPVDATDPLLGSFTGQVGNASDGAAVVPGMACRLTISREGEKTVGEFHAGLVRLPLRAFELEGEIFKAVVGDGADGLDGVLSGKLQQAGESATISGTVTLTQPELEFGFEVTRQGPADDAGEPDLAAEAQVAAGEQDAQEKDDLPEPKAEAREYARGILNATGEQLELGDIVLDKDAESEERDGEESRGERGQREGRGEAGQRPQRAPRYGGIQSFEWAPEGHEMLVLSDGDVYRLKLDAAKWDEPQGEHALPYRGEMERLTRTRERESSVAYLPDGSGYTYLREGALLRVAFDEHTIVQLDPPLEDGERMVGYRISPDARRLVFLAQKREGEQARDDEDGGGRFRRGGGGGGVEENQGGRQVTIISYRDRFATARQVPRMMPDDEFPASQMSIYLYDLEGHEREQGKLSRVFTRKVTAPRDVMYVPEWSPDSSKIAFAAFEQNTGQVSVLEAGFPEPDPTTQPTTRPGEAEDAGEAQEEEDGQRDQEGAQAQQQERRRRGGQGAPEGGPTTRPAEDPEFKVENARVVYRFLHNGGPNTPRMIIPQYLPDSRHLVFVTELSGFRQLHLLDPVYEQLVQLTSGKFEVYPFHISEDHKRLFVTATVEEDPAQEWVYEVDLESRKMRRLCRGEGVMNGVAVSDDGRHLLGTKSDFGQPTELYAFDCSNPESESKETLLSDFHPKPAHELTAVKPEYFTFQNRHGHTIHGHMFKPGDWKPTDKRPLLVYVYGGPLGERKMITRGSYAAPSYFFARYMAEKHGWVTATVDPRGASGFGALFEKANFEQVGKPQTEDLVDAAKWLTEHAGVDEKRRALHGWSFGGFQTQMTMYSEPEVFAAGIAGAGPTEWHNYNSWYTTGTVGDVADFKEKLDQYSLLPLAKNLKGRLLLVHGVEDSNVLYQDTVRVYRELLKAGKEHLVDLFIDPTGGHGMGGDVKSIGQYRKYEDFLLTHLGKGEPSKTEEPSHGLTAEPQTAGAALEGGPTTRPTE